MSYDISLGDKSTNVTFNHYGNLRMAFDHEDGIRSVYRLTGAESVPVLLAAIQNLGNDVDPDPWKATEGNAKVALIKMLNFALMNPEAVWEGD